ncbi:hypothetical protein ACFY6U_33275 [Streptomyces sp. NPDC013157]|uniref:hypothetical protein n=1 Tax=Streptomyces sp. NPDC013157 TaxID=3364861 RepID=UPI0036BD6966
MPTPPPPATTPPVPAPPSVPAPAPAAEWWSDGGSGWASGEAAAETVVASGGAGSGGGGVSRPSAGQWAPAEPPRVTAVGGRLPGRRTVWSVVVGAAVVGVAASLVLTLVVGKGDGRKPATAAVSVTPTPSAPLTPTPSAPGTGGGEPSTDTGSPAPSAGYQLRQDTEGFRVATPEGWTRSAVASSYGFDVVNYRSPDRTHRLQVYQVAEASPDASFELYLSDETPKPDGFQELGLTSLDGGPFTGARLEYVAGTISGEPDVGTWHVYDERFVAQDGRVYAIASYGPDSDGGDDELAYLTTAVDWFCPPDTTCDADPAAD